MEPVRVYRKDIFFYIVFFIMLVLVFGSDPDLVSPFFHDELLTLALPFVSVRRQRERGFGGKNIVP